VLSNYKSPVSTIIVSRVSSLGALELVSGLISAEGVLCLGSPIVIITSSPVSLILGASIRSNTITTSPGSSSFQSYYRQRSSLKVGAIDTIILLFIGLYSLYCRLIGI
jgi:hypothetical protein